MTSSFAAAVGAAWGDVGTLLAILRADVAALDAKKGLVKKLGHRVDKAMAELAKGRQGKACDELDRLAKEIGKQSGRKLPLDEADAVLATTSALRAMMGCPAQ